MGESTDDQPDGADEPIDVYPDGVPKRMDDQLDSVPEPIDANPDGVPEPIDDQSDGANDEPEHLQVTRYADVVHIGFDPAALAERSSMLQTLLAPILAEQDVLQQDRKVDSFSELLPDKDVAVKPKPSPQVEHQTSKHKSDAGDKDNQ